MRLSWNWFVRVAAICILIPAASSGQSLSTSAPEPARVGLSGTADVQPNGQPKAAAAYGNLPLSFEANIGQTNPSVRYLARGSGYQLFLTDHEAVFSITEAENPRKRMNKREAYMRFRRIQSLRQANVRMRLKGASGGVTIVPDNPMSGKSNYMIGKNPDAWHLAVPNYGQLTYKQVYPGIDMVFHGAQGKLEYDFVVAPKANPKLISIQIEGAKPLRLDARGDLQVETSAGTMVFQKPRIYQDLNGHQKLIKGAFAIRTVDEVGISVGRYDRSHPLTIDPVLVYSGYLGGTVADGANDIAIDSQSSAYITGWTLSPDFPISSGISSSFAGSFTAFVTKLDASGQYLVYSTYLGGSVTDIAGGIAVDSNGSAYITGETASPDFPVTSNNCLQANLAADASSNAFLAKLSPDGQSLQYSTFLGGSGSDSTNKVAVDTNQNAYLVGYDVPFQGTPTSADTVFPTTSNAFQPSSTSANGDVFVTRIDTTKAGQNSLIYSTFLGGNAPSPTPSAGQLLDEVPFFDAGLAIAVDSNANVYVAGATQDSDFPITAGTAYQPSVNPNGAAFLTRIDTTQSGAAGLVYSTALSGSTGGDAAYAVALDSNGYAYVTGDAESPDFPVTTGVANNTLAGKSFVAKFDTTQSQSASLLYSTLVGGSVGELADAIAVDPSGRSYFGGFTASTDFPVTTDAIQSTLGANGESSFLAVLSSDASQILYATYLGGSGSGGFDLLFGIALDSGSNPNIFIDGVTASPNFQTTPTVPQTSLSGEMNAFVAELSPVGVTPPIITSISTIYDLSGVFFGMSGTAVTINGTNFGSVQGSGSVRLGGVAAPVSSWSDTAIVVSVPINAPPGFSDAAVSNGSAWSNSFLFIVVPVITTLSPAAGPIGATVDISGTNLGTSGSVTFNGTSATTTSWSPTNVVAIVPAGATSGNLIVTSNNIATSFAGETTFTVTSSPSVSGISPASGPADTPVTITGSNFGASQAAENGNVVFNGADAPITSWSATSIVAQVPDNAAPGTGTVSVNLAGVSTTAYAFTVVPQSTSVNPSSGAIGQIVAIMGDNFGATQGSGTVQFGTTTAVINSWTPTEINVEVPSMPLGATTITVTVGSTVTNSLSFTVVPASSLTGLPPFGSFSQSPFDTINNQNLNVHFAIPIISTLARGAGLSFAPTYDSLIWQLSGSAWTPTTTSIWGWDTDNTIGKISYGVVSNPDACHSGDNVGIVTHYQDYRYIDPIGTAHNFSVFYDISCTNTGTGSLTGQASDNSGYSIDITAPTDPIVRGRNGVKIVNSTLTQTDRNGNITTGQAVSSTETDWTDSAGHVGLKIVHGTNMVTYEVLNPSGTYENTVFKYQDYNVMTNFGCSGITEYNQTASLLYEIDLPDSTTYSFDYEATPSNTGYVTGRIQTVTLPTGGSYEYTYSGANDGINCTDGTTLAVDRTISDGSQLSPFVWTFARGASNTTVTAPVLPYDSAGNPTVYTFNGAGSEISRQVYQGAATGTPLRTINTTWAGNGTPNASVTILEDNSTQSERDMAFDSNGNLLRLVEFDWGTGAHGSVLRSTSYSYMTDLTYTNNNLVSLLHRKTITDSTNVIQYRQDITYDGVTLGICPTGAAQHDDVNYSCSFVPRGNPTSVTVYIDPATPSTPITKNFTYDVFGNLRTAQVNSCNTEAWTYSSATQYAYPDSVVCGSSGTQLQTSFSYNAWTGQVISTTDPNNAVRSTTYDALGRTITVTRPDLAQIIYSYDDTDLLGTVTTPLDGTNSVTKTTSLDELGRPHLVATTDVNSALLASVQVQFDPLGRSSSVSNPYTNRPQYWRQTQFDALGRKTNVILQDGSEETFSYSGASVTFTSPAGRQRQSIFDAAGRLVTVNEPDVTNGNTLDVQTSYTYSVLNKPLQITQGSQTRTFTYDALGRRTSVAAPETNQVPIQYQYNNFNLVTQRTDARGVVKTYTYDGLNRLASTSYDVGSTGVAATPGTTYTFGTSASQNNNGRLVTLTDEAGSKTYAYDVLGRQTRTEDTIGGQTYSVGYAYNQASEVTALTYPSGRLLTQGYDTFGRATTVADSSATYASDASYDPNGHLTSLTYGNSVCGSFDYSPDRGQIVEIDYFQPSEADQCDSSPGTDLVDLMYGYGENGANDGEITSIADGIDSGRSATYTYDALRRISSATTQGSTDYPAWALSWTYDRYGNRTAQTVNSGTAPANALTVDPTTNRVTTSGYAYDASGNMINDGQNTLTYDAANRLISSNGILGLGTYAYHDSGHRAVKASGGNTVVYVYSGSRVLAEYTNGNISQEYIYMGQRLIASYEGTALYYHHYDHLSVRMMTDATGNTVGEQGNYPYGEPWYLSDTTSKWAFTTYERDLESGNDYATARYYENRVGRFLSIDPLLHIGRNPQEFNRYAYVQDDPINKVDPQGLDLVAVGDGFLPPEPNWYDGDPGALPPFPHDGGDQGGQFGGGQFGGGGASGSWDPDSSTSTTSSSIDTDSPVNIPEFGGSITVTAAAAAAVLTEPADLPTTIETPYGTATQEISDEALSALSDVEGGATIYRTGTFDIQDTSDGQFWSFMNPASTEGYGDMMGMADAGATQDWVIGARLLPGAAVLTRAAPGLMGSTGGAMEAVTEINAVEILFFVGL